MELENTKAKGRRILLLGVYGMEMVECGGVLNQNAVNGGVSHACILFAGVKMREDLNRAAEILRCSIEYLGMDVGTISASFYEKLEVIRVIREFCPDIIITQDPEHCISDLDPGRRPAMTLLLEAMALAGRDLDCDKLQGLKPHRQFTVYYMTPEHPNCLVNIASSWEKKCEAMDVLESQLEFIAQLAEDSEAEKQYGQLIPGFAEMETQLERGRAIKQLMDKAFYLYYGSTGHNDVLLSEAYRREGMFIFNQLPK